MLPDIKFVYKQTLCMNSSTFAIEGKEVLPLRKNGNLLNNLHDLEIKWENPRLKAKCKLSKSLSCLLI
jgi:hypothetical protein